MRYLTIIAALLISSFCQAQTNNEEAVINTVKQLFNGMRAKDTAMVRGVFHPTMARLYSTGYTADYIPSVAEGNLNKFIAGVTRAGNKLLDERITYYEVRVDDNLATVWAPYEFYLDSVFSHCGVNAFQLVNTADGWKILTITDSRRNKDCVSSTLSAKADSIHQLMNNWHHAAAVADEDVFFGSMAEDCIYLGTDGTERWGRDEMQKWSKQFFDRDTAWAFTPHNREIYFSADGNYAWFEEKLDTWMGECRGSGVLKLTPDGWKLTHYNLAVVVPNEKIKQYIEIINQKPNNKN